MIKALKLICVLLIVNFFKCELLFVFEHFRHGARSPGFTVTETKYNHTDEYGIFWETNGELTSIGLRTQYLIGARNRKRYNNLLSKKYNPREIIAFSTQMTRTIRSAQTQLIGMYPPSTEETINEAEARYALPPNVNRSELSEEIKELGNKVLPGGLQVVPVYAIPEEEVHQLLSDIYFCPKLRTMKNKKQYDNKLMEFYHQLNSTFGKELLHFLNKSNESFYLYDFYRVFYLADVFLSDYDNQRDLSALEKEGINLQKYYNISIEMKNLFLFYSECDEFISSIAVSKTMRKIIKWMEKRIECDIRNEKELKFEEPKFVMYSGHDTTMAPFQLFMKKVFHTPLSYPHFSSTLYYELHHNDSLHSKTINDYFIKYYIDDTLLLTVNYSTFKKKVESILWSKDRIDAFCSNSFLSSLSCLGFIGLIIIICFILIGIQFILKKGKTRKGTKKADNQEIGQELI